MVTIDTLRAPGARSRTGLADEAAVTRGTFRQFACPLISINYFHEPYFCQIPRLVKQVNPRFEHLYEPQRIPRINLKSILSSRYYAV